MYIETTSLLTLTEQIEETIAKLHVEGIHNCTQYSNRQFFFSQLLDTLRTH